MEAAKAQTETVPVCGHLAALFWLEVLLRELLLEQDWLLMLYSRFQKNIRKP
ncbi:hypothetical protein D3C75_468110 [compost metagenome]